MSESPDAAIEVSVHDASQALAEDSAVVLIDCRESYEHEYVALPNSRHIPLGELPVRVSEIIELRERPIIVYCHVGVRSLHAALWLRARGFTRVRSLQGGIDAWSVQIDATLPRY
jgi:rhodanese-related sulfurtransferase